MDECWDTDAAPSSAPSAGSANLPSSIRIVKGGRPLGKGRGYPATEVGSATGGYGSDFSRGPRGERGTGRGDWGGRGGRFQDGSREFRRRTEESNDNDSGWKRNGDYGNSSGGFGRRARNNENEDGGDGGYGGSGNYGRGKDFGNRDNSGGNLESGEGEYSKPQGNEEEKPRPPPYIPPELPENEEELYKSGIETGIHFKDFENIPVQATGNNVPEPITSFESSGLRTSLLENLEKCGYKVPTPIQKHAIPCIMAGRDVMATAQTGSGKTAAFGLPILHKLLEDRAEPVFDGTHCEPQTLILSPTRELAIQIYEVFKKFSRGTFIKAELLYGGTAVSYQKRKLLNGVHVLIATPGRLDDFVKRGLVSFNSIQFVVLDEADRMLDMGFRDSIAAVMNHETMNPKGERLTLMFSATFSGDVQTLAASYLHDYIFIAVGIVGGACKDVEQVFYEVQRKDKKSKLKELLTTEGTKGSLVFIETKRNADFIASFLADLNIPTTSIHGDRFQSQREQALRDFKSGKMDVLVATSVAARGLDIRGVKHVINFDLPQSVDEYVHRIGRTGRLGNYGKASSFYDRDSDNALVSPLVKILKEAGQPIPEFFSSSGFGHGGDSYNSSSYGGEDHRTFDNTSAAPPAATGGEENWDF